MKHFHYDLFNNNLLICKTTVYLTYVFSFLSIWYVILFSIERLIAVCFPLKRYDMCNSYRNKIAIILLIIFSLIFYSFSLFTTGIEYENNLKVCVTYENWVSFVKKISFVDIWITIIIPFLIILIVNISISLKLMRNQKRPIALRKKLSSLKSYGSVRRTSTVGLCSLKYKRRLSKKYSRTTRVLLTISITYVLLNTLMAFSKIRYCFDIELFGYDKKLIHTNTTLNSTHNHHDSRIKTIEINYDFDDQFYERVSCYLFYMNFSLNFFIYCANRTKFRESFLSFRKRKNSRSYYNQSLCNRIN
ncbi:unnamed protein product [Brachionus calyciflorus]|uniref:G-protein coupled receptors family 1 profile domain-containing protein n=1 Tax=Brachionus calyciflorus TaxID=104777 RepID=A0A814BUU6_9BILA|nr:unnamed protein product [Brachionus calyciflorus]